MFEVRPLAHTKRVHSHYRKRVEDSGRPLSSDFFLTHYEEYPIYEPAEGGYYYAGQDEGVAYFGSIREVRKQLLKMSKEDDWTCFPNGIRKTSSYIGNEEKWLIEKKYGDNRKGKVAYE